MKTILVVSALIVAGYLFTQRQTSPTESPVAQSPDTPSSSAIPAASPAAKAVAPSSTPVSGAWMWEKKRGQIIGKTHSRTGPGESYDPIAAAEWDRHEARVAKAKRDAKETERRPFWKATPAPRGRLSD